MRVIKIVAITLLFLIAFSGCSQKLQPKIEFVKVPVKVPHLKTCRVSSLKVRVKKEGKKVCMAESEYNKLKKQNYRLRVCNELLNKQIKDFNRKYAK